MSIAADEAVATGIDFQAKSEWRFNGHVRITLDSAVVTSDSAVFTFDDKQLARGELAGQATFEDPQPGGKEPARGGANKIVYDYAARTLRLTENAWFQTRVSAQATGCDLVYNLTTERVTSGSSDCSDQVSDQISAKAGRKRGRRRPAPMSRARSARSGQALPARARSSRTSVSRSTAAKSWGCWARTAPARPRRSI